MGSSGMKRKGRTHLPKVGTRPAMEHQLHDRRESALHPFAEDPYRRDEGRGHAVVAMLVALVVLIGVIAVVIAT